MVELKKAELWKWHTKFAKMGIFSGWSVPLWYSSTRKEHINVRSSLGLFDVSHMGKIFIYGKDASTFLQYLTTNNLSSIEKNKIIYSVICNERGGVKDDILIYRLAEDKFMVVCNSVNIYKIYNWFQCYKKLISHYKEIDVKIENKSFEISLFSVQGPLSEKLLNKFLGLELASMPWFTFTIEKDFLISHSGYTGEDGFEIFVFNKKAIEIFTTLLKLGKKFGLIPCGIYSRDTLRLEAGYTLYGNESFEYKSSFEEIDFITPLESGLSFAVDFSKDFVGKDALIKLKSYGKRRVLKKIELIDRGVPRKGARLYNSNKDLIGEVTSGNINPTNNKGIALISIDPKFNDEKLYMEFKNKKLKAKVVKKFR